MCFTSVGAGVPRLAKFRLSIVLIDESTQVNLLGQKYIQVKCEFWNQVAMCDAVEMCDLELPKWLLM